MCQTPSVGVMAKTSRCPSAFCAPRRMAMDDPIGLPSVVHPDQPAFGVVWYACHTVLVGSLGARKISSLPSTLRVTPSAEADSGLFSGVQADQSALGATCQLCETAPPASIRKSSRHVSALCPSAIAAAVSVSELKIVQPTQSPPGEPCQLCQSCWPEVSAK